MAASVAESVVLFTNSGEYSFSHFSDSELYLQTNMCLAIFMGTFGFLDPHHQNKPQPLADRKADPGTLGHVQADGIPAQKCLMQTQLQNYSLSTAHPAESKCKAGQNYRGHVLLLLQ